MKHALRYMWEVLKLWGNENVGNATETIVNNDEPTSEGEFTYGR